MRTLVFVAIGVEARALAVPQPVLPLACRAGSRGRRKNECRLPSLSRTHPRGGASTPGERTRRPCACSSACSAAANPPSYLLPSAYRQRPWPCCFPSWNSPAAGGRRGSRGGAGGTVRIARHAGTDANPQQRSMHPAKGALAPQRLPGGGTVQRRRWQTRTDVFVALLCVAHAGAVLPVLPPLPLVSVAAGRQLALAVPAQRCFRENREACWLKDGLSRATAHALGHGCISAAGSMQRVAAAATCPASKQA